MPRTALILLAVLSLAIVTGCGGKDEPEPVVTPDASQPASSEDLQGRSFTSSSVEGHELVADTKITLDFGTSTLGVSAGCNSTSGKYEIQEYNLHFKPGPTTLMGCPKELLDQDEWLNDFLEAGPGADLDGGDLTLTGADGVSIVLMDSTGPPGS